MFADYHVHTAFSDDSVYPMENVIQDAIAMHMDEICFTEHVDYGIKFDQEPGKPILYRGNEPLTNCDYPLYFKTIEEMKKRYGHQITIKTGMEFGMQKHTIPQYQALFDRYSLESPTIERLMQDYALGATKDGSIIYWQIDTKGKVRTGKVMKYDPNTGHRVKDGGGINWIHAMMKKQGLLPDDYHLVQCLFGEHLLKIYPTKVVALVESEKSALIASGVYPDYVWLATGGKSQLSIDKLKVLQGRTVVMFPDVDGFEYWSNKAKEVEAIGCKVVVSDLLEKNATDEDRANKIDIADWLIRCLSESTVTEVKTAITETEKILQAMIEANPALQLLIDTFDLELVV